MTILKRIAISTFGSATFLLFTLAPVYAADPVAPEKRQRIEQLLEITGALNIGKMMSQAVTSQMSNALKQARPDIPATAFDMIEEEVNNVVSEALSAPGGFVDQIVPIYDKYFSVAELDALIDFYRSPAGQKAISVMPQITQDAMRIGQRWGQSLGPVIAERIKARLQAQGINL